MGCCGIATRIETARVNGRVLALPCQDDFQGPLHDRVCRDVIFLILFIAAVVGAIAYLVFAGTKGDPERLIRGYDDYGNVCGKKNPTYFDLKESGKDYTNHPFLEMTVKIDGETKRCIEKCPSDTNILVGYYCFPGIPVDSIANKSDHVSKAIFGTTGESFFKTLGKDLRNSWKEILLMCFIALVLTIIITAMLRFIAQVVVYITIIIMVIGCIGGTIFFWLAWHFAKTALDNQKSTNNDANAGQQMSDYEIEYEETRVRNLLVGAIFFTIFAVLMLVLLVAMRKRIKLVIALFKEAGKALASLPFLLLQPVWTLIWLIVVFLIVMLGVLLIESAGDPQLFKGTVVFIKSDFISYMRWYHFFMFLWVTQFVIACQYVTIAGSVAQWYFTRNKKELGWPIVTAMKRMFRYHLGSIALGSLIIAIVQFVRAILKFVEKRMSPTNEACKCLLKCCQCCLWCFEKFLKFLTRNAYIEIAIYGYGFCKAAQKAFALLVSNALRVAAINSVGAFVLFLSKLAIAISTFFIGRAIMKSRDDVTYWWAPVTVATLFAYLIAVCFISVYDMTIDTLFLCFCEDCERNNGLDRPYYMSRGLMQFVENSKKAIEALESRKKDDNWATNVLPTHQNEDSYR